MRHFEFSEGTSNKFWEIELDGDSFTVRYGKIGTDGQTQTKTFDSPDKAQKEYDKLVAEKVKKGYVEGGGGTPAPRPAAARPAAGPANSGMATLWQRVEAVLKSKHPERYEALGTGATDPELGKLERTLGVVLPEDFKASLRLHNGSGNDLLRGWELLSTARIAEEWKVWKDLYDEGDFEDAESDPDKGVHKHWWHPLWIPVTSNWSGDHQCLDLDPAPGGKRGQVINMWHDNAPRELQGGSFEEWFGRFVTDLEAGRAYPDDDDDSSSSETEAPKGQGMASDSASRATAGATATAPAAASIARRFEFSEGTSNKFWEISLDGDSFTVCYGKLGTDGQSKTKTFDSPAQAKAEYEKLVAEKVKKGYEEV